MKNNLYDFLPLSRSPFDKVEKMKQPSGGVALKRAGIDDALVTRKRHRRDDQLEGEGKGADGVAACVGLDQISMRLVETECGRLERLW